MNLLLLDTKHFTMPNKTILSKYAHLYNVPVPLNPPRAVVIITGEVWQEEY